MEEIKKLGIIQTSKITAIIYAVISAIFFVPLGLFGIALGNFKGIILVLSPLIYFVVTFIGVALFCLIYNFLADKIGGIEIEIESK